MLKRKESEQMQTEPVTGYATISVNRQRRFWDNNIDEQIFQEVLNQARETRT